MKFTNFAAILLFTLLSSNSPTHAEPQSSDFSQSLNSATPTKADILNACVRNQAETLPNPYTDVEPTHWAYKAVLSMYYCGAFRQATPPALIEQLLESDSLPVQEK
ncbi:hypothetical protein M595_4630 [Lyngbya aestuarii BL J]|uniref:S-layer protein n=1 Tax=Lyngbya aestuarii BL J TaxID=1348334 RepID=U7QC74_9CYAN|nr:hypothetical protein [Lyngbya aestuarii]ERT05403.1 hypothetical protein M595_4630 [Lyngbya aestuarii BL J]